MTDAPKPKKLLRQEGDTLRLDISEALTDEQKRRAAIAKARAKVKDRKVSG